MWFFEEHTKKLPIIKKHDFENNVLQSKRKFMPIFLELFYAVCENL